MPTAIGTMPAVLVPKYVIAAKTTSQTKTPIPTNRPIVLRLFAACCVLKFIDIKK